MKTTMDDLLYAWGELTDLRRKARDRGNVWTKEDLELHEKLVADIDGIVAKLPSAWTAWKESI
jgi:hypothetical protein